MRKLTIAVLFTVLAVGLTAQTASAQDDRIIAKGDDPGDMALLFNINSVLNDAPTNFDGIGVGFRYVAVPRLTVRAGLGLDRNTVETELPNSTTEDNSNTLALELGAEYMMFQSGPVGVYGGGILQFATSSTEPEGSDGTETTAFTIAAVFGVNYFLLENLALGAEYRLGFTQSQTENKDSDITTTDSTLGTGAVGFILSFWFE